MGITIYSPFSGREVKIRDNDLGKAVKDEEGRLFYVLERPDGSGYYAAPTRAGGEKDIASYDRMLEKQNRAKTGSGSAQAAAYVSNVGKKKKGGLVKLIIILAIIGGLVWAYMNGMIPGLGGGDKGGDKGGETPAPSGMILHTPAELA
ncbi:MAG: hypothetical protein GC159_09525 [Phycisphaera sp.]|nr:hypothetical protein [Phycisphaera sp.]